MPKSRRSVRRRRRRAPGTPTTPGAIVQPTGNGFGMPPATTDQATTSYVSGAGNWDTEREIATPEDPNTIDDRMITDEMITLEDTLEDNLKDKYSNDLPRHEFDSPKTVGSPNVMGRLKARVSQWAKMGASDYILQTLETGYKLPLLDTPEPRLFKNNKSALRNGDFVETAINELLDTGRITKLRTAPKVVNPLSVTENGDKKRHILDLRYVNQH